MKICLSSATSCLALGLVLAVAGCVSPPKDEPRLRLVDENTLGLHQNPLPKVGEGWWRVFGDAQLNGLIDDALQNNHSLNEALVRVRGAQAQVLDAGAALRPGVSLDGDETRQRLSENYIYPPAAVGFGVAGGDAVWMGQIGANLSWGLDFWGRHAETLKQARALSHAAELDVYSARLALSGAMAQSYVELHHAYAMADIASQQEHQCETLLKLTQNRVKVGLDAQVELRLAEAVLPQAHKARLQADIQRELAVHNLAALAGHGADIYAGIGRPQLSSDASLPLPHDLSIDLLSRRPDVLATKARVEAATAGRAAAKAAFYPDINLKMFAGYQSIGLDNLLKSGSLVYGAGPAIHLPLFDSKRLNAGYLRSTAELDAAIANYNDTVLKAVRDVADQLSRIDSLSKQISQTQAGLAATEAAYKLAQHRYQAGLSSQLVVLNAETQWLNARRDLLGLSTQLLISRVALLLTLGGSFDPTLSSVTRQEFQPAGASL